LVCSSAAALPVHACLLSSKGAAVQGARGTSGTVLQHQLFQCVAKFLTLYDVLILHVHETLGCGTSWWYTLSDSISAIVSASAMLHWLCHLLHSCMAEFPSHSCIYACAFLKSFECPACDGLCCLLGIDFSRYGT
jgi:hypothetical protein